MIRYARVVALNRYYKITHFYTFLKDTAFKGVAIIFVFVGLILLLEYFFIDINGLLSTLVESYSSIVIFLFFLLSETFLGLLPPEIFIAWAAKAQTPWLYLFILASLSYIGGIIAYFLGKLVFSISWVREYIEPKIARHISNLRKWGGFLVLVGAMLPIPHSIISLASGLIRYPFRYYLFWALFRYIRFLIYALVVFRIF